MTREMKTLVRADVVRAADLLHTALVRLAEGDDPDERIQLMAFARVQAAYEAVTALQSHVQFIITTEKKETP